MYTDPRVPKYWIDYVNHIMELSKKKDYKLSTNNNNIAVLIEPREHFLLEGTLHNFLYRLGNKVEDHTVEFVSKDWTFCIIHGTKNKKFVENITKNIPNIILHEIPFDNLTFKLYNKLFTNHEFWSKIPTSAENILIYQTDAILLKDNIDDFLEYDYIGAPWRNDSREKQNEKTGGNGGLSLRKRSKMIEICKKKGNTDTNEDVYFDKCNINYPTFEIAKSFSVETLFYNDPFGIHNAYNHIKDHNVSIKELLKY